MRILVTGGAGFVGASLASAFADGEPGVEVVALDNLRRRGSERNIARLTRRGVRFVHGDVRIPDDLWGLDGSFDWVIDASAEPSVLAGVEGSPAYVIDTNLRGTLHCLEFCRRRAAGLFFLSTSRVYSIGPLRALPLRETGTRLELDADAAPPGAGRQGIAERFPTDGPRSYYGASKLASELFVQEYAEDAGLPAVILRCGTLAGPGQFGRVEQGVFALWMARHYFRGALRYTGFGGTGKQVRDLLHPLDLHELLVRQMQDPEPHRGRVYNVGGGPDGSVSLREYTDVCREVTGNEIPIGSEPASAPVDVPWYVSDHREVSRATGWMPQRGVRAIATEVCEWLKHDEEGLRALFA